MPPPPLKNDWIFHWCRILHIVKWVTNLALCIMRWVNRAPYDMGCVVNLLHQEVDFKHHVDSDFPLKLKPFVSVTEVVSIRHDPFCTVVS